MTSEERSNMIDALVESVEDWNLDSLIRYAKINSRIALINMNDERIETEWNETFGERIIH
tara:strand:- start:53 stop:232 length:180 start_codon:yes stop_codon:yes gene_type:complete